VAADDRATKTRDLLAQRIIEVAQRGERDKRRLVEDALDQFVNSI
jgi:predicted transcriptional regulator